MIIGLAFSLMNLVFASGAEEHLPTLLPLSDSTYEAAITQVYRLNDACFINLDNTPRETEKSLENIAERKKLIQDSINLWKQVETYPKIDAHMECPGLIVTNGCLALPLNSNQPISADIVREVANKRNFLDERFWEPETFQVIRMSQEDLDLYKQDPVGYAKKRQDNLSKQLSTATSLEVKTKKDLGKKSNIRSEIFHIFKASRKYHEKLTLPANTTKESATITSPSWDQKSSEEKSELEKMRANLESLLAQLSPETKEAIEAQWKRTHEKKRDEQIF